VLDPTVLRDAAGLLEGARFVVDLDTAAFVTDAFVTAAFFGGAFFVGAFWVAPLLSAVFVGAFRAEARARGGTAP